MSIKLRLGGRHQGGSWRLQFDLECGQDHGVKIHESFMIPGTALIGTPTMIYGHRPMTNEPYAYMVLPPTADVPEDEAREQLRLSPYIDNVVHIETPNC